MKGNGFVPILVLFITIFVALGAIGFLILKNFQNITPPTGTGIMASPTPGSLKVANEYNTIFSGVSRVFSENLSPSVQMTTSSNGTLYWPVSNGSFASITPSQEVQISNYCGVTSGDDSAVENKVNISLAKLDEYLLSIGFKNVSSPAFTNSKFSDAAPGVVIGYQNDNQGVDCTLVFDNVYFSCQSPPTGKLTCNSIEKINQNSALQQDYLLAFGRPGEAIEILGQYGSYYYFNISSPIGPGGGLFAEKSPTGWMKIEASQQAFITCDSANKYKVPHQLKGADKCIDSNGNSISNPN